MHALREIFDEIGLSGVFAIVCSLAVIVVIVWVLAGAVIDWLNPENKLERWNAQVTQCVETELFSREECVELLAAELNRPVIIRQSNPR